jgi:hypothetical protein
MHARALSLRHGNRTAAAGGHVRLPTSPTTRAAAAPEKARPRRETVATTARIKWPGPLHSKDDPRSGPSPRLEKLDSRRVQLLTSGLEARSAWMSATGALDLRNLLISGSRVSPAGNPQNLQMQKGGGT